MQPQTTTVAPLPQSEWLPKEDVVLLNLISDDKKKMVSEFCIFYGMSVLHTCSDSLNNKPRAPGDMRLGSFT